MDFEKELLKTKNILLKYAISLTNNSETAKDLLQDTLLTAIEKKNKYKQDKSLINWLYKIMQNKFVDDYRRQQKYAPTQYLVNSKNNRTAEKEKDFDDYTEREEFVVNEYSETDFLKYDLIKKYIKKQKRTTRHVIRMFIKGYKYHEISEKLAIKNGKIRIIIFRFRKELNKALNLGKEY